MANVLVFFATTEGQTRRIAEQIATTLREQGLDSEALHLAGDGDVRIDWARLEGVIVGASVHVGRHQRAVEEFVRREVDRLNRVPSGFFSVSLAAASRRPSEVNAALGLARQFVGTAGWKPQHLACVAGKLAYSKYGFFTRQMMRFIAWREGAPTDTRRDYEFTDWDAVRQFALDVAGTIRAKTTSAA